MNSPKGLDLLRRAAQVHRIRPGSELLPGISRSTTGGYPPTANWEYLGFARTTFRRFYGSLNHGSEVWPGLYWLNLHDRLAEWVAVDTPGNFENGIRIFGSGGDDIVYARVAWQRRKDLSSRLYRQTCRQNCC
jgi:hypothetical protein